MYKCYSLTRFSRSVHAQLLPSACGLYNFTLSVPFDLFMYNSQIANTVSYSTVYWGLQEMSVEAAYTTKLLGQNKSKLGVIVLDNVQNYLLQWDACIGQENLMNVGIAGTFVSLNRVNLQVTDLEDKQACIRQNFWKDVRIWTLLGFINHEHIDSVVTLY